MWTRCSCPARIAEFTVAQLRRLENIGVPLDAVALEYSEARKILDGVALVDAARFYARHHGRDVKRKAVTDAVREMIEAKKTARE